FDSGATVAYTYSHPVSSSVSGKRYALTTPSPNPVSPISVSGPVTVTGTYKAQYQLTFTQSGIAGDSTGTVVTVDSSAKTAGNLPFTDWFDNSASVQVTYNYPVSSIFSVKRYELTTPSTSPVSP